VKEERNILHGRMRMETDWIGHVLRRNCLLKQVIEMKSERRTEVTGRRGIRYKQLMYGLKERRGYWKLEMGALDLTAWRNRFERGYGHVVWQTKK
jgi:hypothetical protein